MNNDSIIKLYIKYLIIPLETIIRSPSFLTNYSEEKQQTINQLLLNYYQEIEALMKDKN